MILFHIKDNFWWVAVFVLQFFLNRPNFKGNRQKFDLNKFSDIMNVNLNYWLIIKEPGIVKEPQWS